MDKVYYVVGFLCVWCIILFVGGWLLVGLAHFVSHSIFAAVCIVRAKSARRKNVPLVAVYALIFKQAFSGTLQNHFSLRDGRTAEYRGMFNWRPFPKEHE